MRRRTGARLTLTNRLLLLAALIVVSTTVLILATSAAGVYEMAGRQQSTRLAAFRDILVAEVQGRLAGAFGLVRTAADDAALQGDAADGFRAVMSRFVLENAQDLEGMVLLESDGTMLEAWPPDVLGGATLEALGAAEASATTTPFILYRSADDRHAISLWALVAVRRADAEPRLLLGRIRTEFVGETLTDISELPGAPTALIFDPEGGLIFHGEAATGVVNIDSEFTADGKGASTGEVRVTGDIARIGPYAEVLTPKGLGWKVAVVDSPTVAWRETLAALMPGMLGWVAALAVALVGALAVVGRVTQPLRQLERRARALASGVSLEPEVVTESDEVGRLVEAFNSVVVRLNRMNDIAELLARASDRSLVLDGVTSAIAHMLGAVDAEVLLLGEGGRLDLVAAEGVLADREGLCVNPGDVGWIASAIATGLPAQAPGGVRDPYLDLHGSGATAALAAPLYAAEETIGVTVVVRHDDMGFTETESETVRTFAAQASVALQNARLFEDERRSRREAESLRSVAERVAAPGDIEAVLFDVAEMQSSLVGFGTPRVVLADRAAYGLMPSQTPSSDRGWLAVWDVVAPDRDGLTDSVWVESVTAPADVADVLRQEGAEAALITPMYRASGLAGVMVLTLAGGIPAPSARRRALAGTVGRQASLALENAYLYQQAKSRADNLETIFRISHAVGSSLQSRIVLNRVLDVVQKILSADAVMLMTYDAQHKTITVPMARGILHRDMLDASFRPGEDVPGRVFETREPERYDRISSSDTLLLNLAAEQGLESLLAVPLLARGRSIGVLVVFARGLAAFSTDDLDLLRTFASQAALAIDTADMFSREHNVATILQESILPTRLPRIVGVEASSVYLPAGTDADIGGDYYDLFTAPDGRVVVSIGDVCGKGVAAATKTSMIRYAIRGMVVAGLGPSRVLTELNQMLAESGDALSIVTLWLGYIDTTSGMLSYANGGHPPGLLLRPSDSRIERLSTTGALLGAVSGVAWTEREAHLEPGSLLVLYTDGVTEARREGRFFGEGRVRRALRGGGTAASVAQRLLGQVQRFAAGELRDDAAILTVEYTGAGDVSA